MSFHFLAKLFNSGQYVDLDRSVFFLHIAKAAGSSVNRFFTECLRPDYCLTHVESIPDWRRKLEGKKFVSGHVLYNNVCSIPYVTDSMRITVVREPWDYLISHLNWIARLAKPENKVIFNRRPECVQKLAIKIFECDFSYQLATEEFLHSLTQWESALLINSQTRYLAIDSVNETARISNVESALDCLRKFEYVGEVSRIDEFFRKIALDIGKTNSKPISENKLYDKHGLGEVSKQSKECLSTLIDADLLLFENSKQQGLLIGY